MNSRQRVLKAVNFQKPDRIPIDLGASRASSINVVIYDQLKRKRGMQTPAKVRDSLAMLADVEIPFLEKIHADVIPLDVFDAAWSAMPPEKGLKKRLFCGLEAYFPPTARIRENPDGSWSLLNAAGQDMALMPKNGFYFDLVKPTMSGSRIDPRAFQPVSTVPDEELQRLSARAAYLYENTDKAILGWGEFISVLGMSAVVGKNITQGSLDEWLCMLMTEKETVHEMIGRAVDAVIQCLALYHQAVGNRCFAWGIAADDAGTQKNSLIAPGLFAEMIKPHYKRLCDWVHTHTHWKTFLHSCGSIYPLLPEWIDAGIDILNPVQISAENMAPEKLMKEFSGRVVFWGGGCDTQKILPFGTPAEIKEHVRHNIQLFGSGRGGYVFTQVHNIQQDVPLENIEAMLAAAYEYGSGCPDHE